MKRVRSGEELTKEKDDEVNGNTYEIEYEPAIDGDESKFHISTTPTRQVTLFEDTGNDGAREDEPFVRFYGGGLRKGFSVPQMIMLRKNFTKDDFKNFQTNHGPSLRWRNFHYVKINTSPGNYNKVMRVMVANAKRQVRTIHDVYFHKPTVLENYEVTPNEEIVLARTIPFLASMLSSNSLIRKVIPMYFIKKYLLDEKYNSGEPCQSSIDAFRPSFRPAQPFEFVISALFNSDVLTKHLDLSSEQINAITDVINHLGKTFVLCSGTAAGQITRLQKCYKVQDDVANVPYPTYEKFKERIKKVFPIKQLKKGLTFDDLKADSEINVSNYAENYKSDAGLPFPVKFYRGDVKVKCDRETTAISTWYNLNAFIDFYKESDFFGKGRCIEALRRFNVARLKPKFEIMTRESMSKKTRSVMVAPSLINNLVGGAIDYAISGSKTFFKRGQAYEGSLYGFSVVHGGLNSMFANAAQVLINKEIAEKPIVAVYYYSDNLYVFKQGAEGIVFYSFDASKMEASTRLLEAKFSIRAILELAYGADMDIAVLEFLVTLAAEFAVDQTTVWEDLLVTFPGLGSGAHCTFLINHLRMAQLASDIIEQGIELDNMKPGDQLDNKKYVHPLVMELEDSSDIMHFGIGSVVRTLVDYKTITEAKKSGCGTSGKFGSIVRLDLLGYDGTWYEFTNVENGITKSRKYFLACLNFDRLSRSLMYRKKQKIDDDDDEQIDKRLHPLVVTCQTYFTYINLYLIGGYAYEVIHNILRALALAMESIVLAEVTAAFPNFKDDEVGLNELFEFFYKRIIPSFSDTDILADEDIISSEQAAFLLSRVSYCNMYQKPVTIKEKTTFYTSKNMMTREAAFVLLGPRDVVSSFVDDDTGLAMPSSVKDMDENLVVDITTVDF